MRISFLPYSFEQKIDDFKPNLSFIGTTYYDVHNVYEHLFKPQSLFGFKIIKVELYFSDESLIGVSTFLDESTAYMEDVKDCLIAYIDETPLEVQNDILQSIGSLIYTWEDDKYVVGLLCDKGEKLFVHVILRDYRLLW